MSRALKGEMMSAKKITHEELREELRAGKKPMEIAKREQPIQWPDESRIDVIGQNGNNGEHYEDEAFKSLEGSNNG